MVESLVTGLEVTRYNGVMPLTLLAFAPRFDVYAMACGFFGVAELAVEMWTSDAILKMVRSHGTPAWQSLGESLTPILFSTPMFCVLVG